MVVQILTKISPRVVPNGPSFVDAVNETAREANLSAIALNGSSGDLKPETESGDVNMSRHRAVVPAVVNGMLDADTVHTRKITVETSEPKTENGGMNGQQEHEFVMENALEEAVAVLQRMEESIETKVKSPATKQRERETQIKSLHIDDDDDDDGDDNTEGQVPATAAVQVSGAEMFASNRPHAWHHDLAKKCRDTANDTGLDRQVC